MKKILIVIHILVTALLFSQSLTNTENYIYSRSYLEPVTSPTPSAGQLQSVQYLDGLGRATQAISIQSTPSGKDVVLPIMYDQNGILSKNYLPLPANTLNGAKHSGITENTINSYYGVANAYSQVDYEKSPLAKVFKKSSPGDAWQINGANTQNVAYLANSASEVKKYKAVTTWDSGSQINNVTLTQASDSLTTNGYYNANTLYKFVAKDEDNNTTETFINTAGLKILVRKVNKMEINLDTYYVYDQANNLVYIIPPAAANETSITQQNDLLNNLCYQYRYDKYNRLAESRLPGRDHWEYTVYDKQGRVALTQDANQHNQSWSFVKYDKFDRPVYTGIYNSTMTRVQLQNALDNASYVTSNENLSVTPFVADGKNIYYTKAAVPSTGFTVLSVNYYDEYPTGSPTRPSTILGINTLGSEPVALLNNGYPSTRSTKSLPTASMVRNIEETSWISRYMWYDQKGQVLGGYNDNHLGGYTKTELKLNFSGLPTEDYTYHKRLDSDTETVVKQRYTYDNQQRLKVHYHQVNNHTEEILSQYEYDELSRVVQKKVGGTSLSYPLETIDYSYDIHGWSTGINKGEFSNPSNKLFAYDIRYDNPVGISPARYNGNISEISWKSLGKNIHKRYNYNYDTVNNLTEAIYSEPSSALPQNGHYNESLEYDANGNILHLTRNAPSFYGNNAETIDQLHYEYNGNKLISVDDETGNPTGYEGGKNYITYDSNGNMTYMPDKSIEEIVYNHLNLPSSIRGNENRKIVRYLYSADGTKLRKHFSVTTDDGQIYGASTDYINGFHYSSSDKSEEIWKAFQEAGGQAYASEAFMEFLNNYSYSNVLKFIPTSEGYYDFENNKYIYQYKDHLGNVRLSFLKDSNGERKIVDQNDYYPFGMNHIRPDDPSYFGFGRYTNFKYNGKELQETGMYDYGWRQYMPDRGRWYGMDQLSEMYHSSSPYAYVENNPVMFMDPNGKCKSDLQGNFPNEECAQPIQEVVINGPKKPKNESIAASPASGWSGPSFLSDIASYFTGGGGSSGGGGGGIFGGGGGGSAPVDPYKKYKEELEAYNIRQARSRYYETQGNPLDDLQGVLDVVGLVPVAGELFDGINGLLYIGRGDKINASASFSAMIPLIGVGTKYTIKGIAHGGKQVLKFTGDEAIGHFGKHGKSIMDASGRSAYNLKDYVNDANWIIQNGTYNPKLNGYYYFMGNAPKGTSIFGFVGVKNSGLNISTFHIKSATQLGLK